MSFRCFGSAAGFVALAALAILPAPLAAQKAFTYSAKMTGVQETPANTATGSGTATFSLKGNTLSYTLTVKELSGPPTMAHIHVGALGASGGHVFTYPLRATKTTGEIAEGTIDLTKATGDGVSGDSIKVLFNNGHAYVNVHTAAHMGGEIRGQVTRP